MDLSNLTGQTLDEKYLIDRELGKGGMGAVYLATHIGTERPVAVKVIAPDFMRNTEFVERFRREARAAGRMRHPNIVDVTDFGFAQVGTDDVAYLVMEYLDGCTLAEVLAEEKRLPLSWVVDIVEQVCSAVDSAHRMGIVHRDLKPDNIWLEPNHRGGYTVKVLDFGIAKVSETRQFSNVELAHNADGFGAATTMLETDSTVLSAQLERRSEFITSRMPTAAGGTNLDLSALPPESSVSGYSISEAETQMMPAASVDQETLLYGTTKSTDLSKARTTADVQSLTRFGSVLGTPTYMSPEQCAGRPSDQRADIYSLGVITYQMLSGSVPFQGKMNEIMRAHQEQEPPPLKIKHVPMRVSQTVMASLAKNPDDRPQTAAALGNVLRAHSEGPASLLRRATTLFTEQLPTLLKVALFVYLPVIFVTLSQVIFHVFVADRLVNPLKAIVDVCLGLLQMGVSFVSASILIASTSWIVTRVIAAPLRPVTFQQTMAALKRRVRQFLPTTMFVNIMSVVGLVLLVIPGILVMINFALATPVMMMEDIKGRAALRRSRQLARRSWRTVTAIVTFQFFMPLLVNGAVAAVVGLAVKAFAMTGMRKKIFGPSVEILDLPFNIFVGSFVAVITALLYLKMRQAGGETMRDIIDRFEEDEMPRSNWQRRLREKSRNTAGSGSARPATG